MAIAHGIPAGPCDVRAVTFQLRQPHGNLHHEDAAVPQPVTGVEVLFRLLDIGFFDEGGHGPGRLCSGGTSPVAGLDVAIGCRGGGWDHPERHQVPGLRKRGPLPKGLVEGPNVSNYVVRVHRHDDRVVTVTKVSARKIQGGQRKRGRCVAADRLDNDLQGIVADLPHLLDDKEPVCVVANDQGRGRVLESLKSAHSRLEHGLCAEQGQELLGIMVAGERPEPRTGATRKYYWIEFHVCLFSAAGPTVPGTQASLRRWWYRSWRPRSRSRHRTSENRRLGQPRSAVQSTGSVPPNSHQ